jgi:branched-chain amino acid transport system ATP-binding protein
MRPIALNRYADSHAGSGSAARHSMRPIVLNGKQPRSTVGSDYILEAKNLVKEFKGFVAVNDVSFKVRRGSIHALIGPNGAGKTTVFNLVTKFIPLTRGTIHFNGKDITREAPAQVARRGLVRSFQISAVFPHLTVLENVRVAMQRKLGTSFHFWRSQNSLNAINDRARALLVLVGLETHADAITVELPYGRKRALEIATTLAVDPELLLLDEPTQGMALEDVEKVKNLIREVATSRTVLMVEHNMSVVAHLCDTITVLQRGSVLAEGTYNEMASNPQVMEAYMGVAHE